MGWVKLFFKCAVGKFLNPSGRLECWQGKVGLCQLTAKLSTVFSCLFFGCVGRPTLAGNVPREGDRNPVLRLRQGYGACTLLPAGIIV
jgi:hypothetical protein